jgi:hypothetical protein
MHFVINTKRPFTSNEEEIKVMLYNLEAAANLRITEFVCNTNLMEFTDRAIIEEGIRIIGKVALETKKKFEYYLVLQTHLDKIDDQILGKKRKILKYFLNKPWEKSISIKGI